MPRFFFDIQSDDVTEDGIGRSYSTAYAAREAAIVMLPLVARQEFPRGGCREVSVLMRNTFGTPLFRASISLNTEWYGSAPDADVMPEFDFQGARGLGRPSR